jgi:hypothetical protein
VYVFFEADCEADFGVLARRIGDVDVEETVALFDGDWSPLDRYSSPMAGAGQPIASVFAYWVVSQFWVQAHQCESRGCKAL